MTNRSTIIIAIISAMIVGGSVYLFDREILFANLGLKESASTLVRSMDGTIKYGANFAKDGKVNLVDVQGNVFDLNVYESTKLQGLPKDKLAALGEKEPWYGLVADLSAYIPEGQLVRVRGRIDYIDLKIIPEEIQIR